MFCIKETGLIILVLATYLCNCKINADSAKFPDATGKYENIADINKRKNYFGSDNFENNITVISNNSKTEEDYCYYEYSDRVLYLFSVSKNCYIIISPIFLILGTVGNFLSITVLRRWVFMFSLFQYRCSFLAHHNAHGASWNFSHHVCIDLLGCTNYLPRECRSTDNIGCLKILLISAGLKVLDVFF